MTTLRRIGLVLFAGILGLGLSGYAHLAGRIIKADGWMAALVVVPSVAIMAVFAYKLIESMRESHWHDPSR